MASRQSRPRFRVQRLPLGLFGYRRDDVLEAATRLEAEQQGADDAFGAATAEQREQIARAIARREALLEMVARLRRDREHLERQLAQARENARAVEAGAQDEIARLEAVHQEERRRFETFLPQVDRAIAQAEGELRHLSDSLDRLLIAALAPEGGQATAELADVVAALIPGLPPDLPLRPMGGGRMVLALPEGGVRLQARGGQPVGRVVGIVVSEPPPRVLGFAVATDAEEGVVPAADVAALRQGVVLLRDAYRLLPAEALPEEATRAIFPVALPARPAEAALRDRTAGPERPAEPVADPRMPPQTDAAGVVPDVAAGALSPAVPLDVAPADARPDVAPTGAGGGGEDGSAHPAERTVQAAADAQDEPQPPFASAAGSDLREDGSAADVVAEGALPEPPRPAEEPADLDGAAEAEPAGAALPAGDLFGAAEDVAAAIEALAAAAPSEAEIPPGAGETGPGTPDQDVQGVAADGVETAGGTPQGEDPHPPARNLDAAPAEAPCGPDRPAVRPPEPAWPVGVPRPAWLLPQDEEGSPEPAPLPTPAPAVPPPAAPAAAQPAERRTPEEPARPAPAGPRPAVPSAVAGGLNILAFIAGKVVGRDLVTQDGRLVAARGASITPELVAEVEACGLLPEMIVYMTLPGAGR